MIYRGTTPTLTFEFPFSVSSIEKCILSFAQNDEVLLEKNLTDFRVQNDKILTLKLTEKETLLFDSQKIWVSMQFKVGINGNVVISTTMNTEVSDTLNDGVLYDGD